ncbi:MAG TPA: hypothetical protein VEJ47_05850 [Candidatus Eremiobacteraceae bacterium]|nr:hypothetical protein [Candidatus Eremiobacteraceae bacterium]
MTDETRSTWPPFAITASRLASDIVCAVPVFRPANHSWSLQELLFTVRTLCSERRLLRLIYSVKAAK